MRRLVVDRSALPEGSQGRPSWSQQQQEKRIYRQAHLRRPVRSHHEDVVPDRRESDRNMLRRRGALAFIVVMIGSFGGHGSAVATRTIPPKPEGDYKLVCVEDVCTWITVSYFHDGREGDTTGKPPTKVNHTKPVCQFGGAAQACTDTELGNWSNSRQCYMKREDPPPPLSDPRWQGHTDGSVWACTREQGYDQGRHLVTRWLWLPGEPDTVVVDPVTLAYQAIATMQLAPPLVESAPAPGQIGLVNMPVWLWVTKTEN